MVATPFNPWSWTRLTAKSNKLTQVTKQRPKTNYSIVYLNHTRIWNQWNTDRKKISSSKIESISKNKVSIQNVWWATFKNPQKRKYLKRFIPNNQVKPYFGDRYCYSLSSLRDKEYINRKIIASFYFAFFARYVHCTYSVCNLKHH